MEAHEYQAMEAIENQHAWFLAKFRFLELALQKIGLSKDKLILDVGCGTGAIIKKLNEAGYKAQGVDVSEEALKYCRQKGLQVIQGGADRLPFADNYFDAVISLDMLEHLKDDRKAVEEISRVIKPGGYLIITVPAHQFLWSSHDEFLHHERRYNKKEILALFDQNFEIVLCSWLHTSILLPTIILRLIKKWLKQKQQQSEVRAVNPILNGALKMIYFWEFWFFETFGFLPFGLSLMVVARKFPPLSFPASDSEGRESKTP